MDPPPVSFDDTGARPSPWCEEGAPCFPILYLYR